MIADKKLWVRTSELRIVLGSSGRNQFEQYWEYDWQHRGFEEGMPIRGEWRAVPEVMWYDVPEEEGTLYDRRQL